MIQPYKKRTRTASTAQIAIPKHAIVLAATPSSTGHLDVVLSRSKELRGIKRWNNCLQIWGGRKTAPNTANRKGGSVYVQKRQLWLFQPLSSWFGRSDGTRRVSSLFSVGFRRQLLQTVTEDHSFIVHETLMNEDQVRMLMLQATSQITGTERGMRLLMLPHMLAGTAMPRMTNMKPYQTPALVQLKITGLPLVLRAAGDRHYSCTSATYDLTTAH